MLIVRRIAWELIAPLRIFVEVHNQVTAAQKPAKILLKSLGIFFGSFEQQKSGFGFFYRIFIKVCFEIATNRGFQEASLIKFNKKAKLLRSLKISGRRQYPSCPLAVYASGYKSPKTPKYLKSFKKNFEFCKRCVQN